ncbi:MAG: hypothetical protein ACJ8EA_16390 [Xanthobacteraceae bacterium]
MRIVSSARDEKLVLMGVDRQVDGLGTFQDAINAGGRLLDPSGVVRPTRYHTAIANKDSTAVHRGQLVPGRERGDQAGMIHRQPVSVTISPPFEARANAAVASPISPASMMPLR